MGIAQGIGQGLYDPKSTPSHNIGDTYVSPEGDEYVYCRAGAVALVAGNALQAPAQLTNHDQLTPVAAAIGATKVTVTLGATAVAANQYAGGKLVIDTTPSLGEEYVIDGHPAADASATLELTLKNGSALRVALTTSSRVTLTPNPYRGVIQAPVTTLTGVPVGVAITAVTAAYYCWIGKNGTFGTLIDQTPGVGLSVSLPSAAAGAVTINSSTLPIVGHMMVTGVDGKVLPVKWCL